MTFCRPTAFGIAWQWLSICRDSELLKLCLLESGCWKTGLRRAVVRWIWFLAWSIDGSSREKPP